MFGSFAVPTVLFRGFFPPLAHVARSRAYGFTGFFGRFLCLVSDFVRGAARFFRRSVGRLPELTASFTGLAVGFRPVSGSTSC
jgi:hypothetical protein